jgi:hypothetical protein
MAKRKKARAPDFRLLVTPHINERTYHPTTMFVLETAQAFAAFRYELTVKEKFEGKSVSLHVLGLKAPSLSLPSPGHAQYIREYENMHGTYAVTVVGLDGTPVNCSVRISEKKVSIVKPPSSHSLILITDKNRWKDSTSA